MWKKKTFLLYFHTKVIFLINVWSFMVDSIMNVLFTYMGEFLGTSLESILEGTQLVSSVQSAWSPQLQPVENRENSQVSILPGRKQVHFFWPAWHSHGLSNLIFRTKCRPNVVPPVFWMCRKTMTSSPLMLKSTPRLRSSLVKLNRGTNRNKALSSAMYGSFWSPACSSLPLVREPVAPTMVNKDPSWCSTRHSDLPGHTYWIMMTPKSNTINRTTSSRWWLLVPLDFTSIFLKKTENHHSGSLEPFLWTGRKIYEFRVSQIKRKHYNAAASLMLAKM